MGSISLTIEGSWVILLGFKPEILRYAQNDSFAVVYHPKMDSIINAIEGSRVYYYFIPNISLAFLLVAAASSSIVIPLISAIA